MQSGGQKVKSLKAIRFHEVWSLEISRNFGNFLLSNKYNWKWSWNQLLSVHLIAVKLYMHPLTQFLCLIKRISEEVKPLIKSVEGKFSTLLLHCETDERLNRLSEFPKNLSSALLRMQIYLEKVPSQKIPAFLTMTISLYIMETTSDYL